MDQLISLFMGPQILTCIHVYIKDDFNFSFFLCAFQNIVLFPFMNNN